MTTTFDWVLNTNGWIGVALGLAIFLMGFIAGISFAKKHLINLVIASTIDSMIKDGYVKTRSVYNKETGLWEEEILKIDEQSNSN